MSCSIEDKIRYAVDEIKSGAERIIRALQQPSVQYRPDLKKSGDLWVASYGEVSAEGKTPQLAMENFNRQWRRDEFI